MTIIECLKKEVCTRISSGNKWMVWNRADEEWEVYEHKYHAKKAIILCRTSSEEKAVKYLIEEQW